MKFKMSGKIQLNPDDPSELYDMDATWEDGQVTGEAAFLVKVKALQLMGTRIGTHPATMIQHLVSPHSTIEIARMVFTDLVISGDEIPPVPAEDPLRFRRPQTADRDRV